VDRVGGAAVTGLGTVLGVWAHPDDETYLSGGLMALARRGGERVVCVSATHGEHGTDDPVAWPPERLARARMLEARAAMAILGVDDHRFLGFEDGTLAGVDPRAGADVVARLLDDVQPDTIVTFGPEGMTGHPDHRAISRWVTGAWCRAGGARGAGTRLLHAAKTEAFADAFADVHDALPIFDPGLPLRTPVDQLALALDLDDELVDVKLAALRAQATQVAPLLAAMGEARYVEWIRAEAVVDADTIAG
jgi:LmbE family N-acetylglucosaminyl deacetylase